MLCRRVLKVYYVYTRILYLRSIVINEIHVANLLANNSYLHENINIYYDE